MAPTITDRPDMAGYGVEDDLDGVLPWTWATERLVGSRSYWVVTASTDGRPHAMPVWGVWRADEDDYWFSCAPTARKVRNLAANDRITVATEDPTRFVSVEGRAERIEPGPTLGPVIDAYAAKYAEFTDGTEEELAGFMAETAFYRVTPERAFGIIETPEDFARRATRWRWT